MTLTVLFTAPTPADLDHDGPVLSFLRADVEDDLRRQLGERLITGRTVIEAIRDRVRADYVALIARVGTCRVGRRTLRMAMGGSPSRWWYHPLAVKDPVPSKDPTYLRLLQLGAIREVARTRGAAGVRLVGADPGLAACLRSALAVEAPDVRSPGLAGALARAGAGRLASGALTLVLGRWLRGSAPAPADVAFEAHWGVTLRDGDGDRALPRDAMHRELPAELADRGVRCAWWAWIDGASGALPDVDARRSLRRAARAGGGVVALQGLLSPGDVVRAALDLRPLIAVARLLRTSAWEAAARVDGVDVRPLLDRSLLVGAAGSFIPRMALAEAAAARAAAAQAPRVLVTCTELFPHARALDAGARRGRPDTARWAAQHAAYTADKTYGVLAAGPELHGEPDGAATPAPDRILAIGAADAELWRGDGFPSAAVEVVGGLRYAAVGAAPLPREPSARARRLLLVASLDTQEADLDLVAAVVRAAGDDATIELRLRNHPVERVPVSSLDGFAPFAARVAVTTEPLEDDLRWADVAITAHSSTVCEALVGGLPAWRWVDAGPDWSSLLELDVVPRPASVDDLRALLADPAGCAPPTAAVRQRVLRDRFGPEPAGVVARVADRLTAVVG